MKRLARSPALPVAALLALGSLLFLRDAPAWAFAVMAVAAASPLALRRLRGGRRSLAAVVLACGLAGVAAWLVPWSSAVFLTLMLAVAGWLKLAERDGPRDRFAATLAGLVLVALGLMSLPPDAALIVIAASFACLVGQLARDSAPGYAPRSAWIATATPALVVTALLFVFTPRITGNLNVLAFALDLPFVVETEQEANRKPPEDDAELKEFRAEQGDMRVLVADFSTASPPFDKFAPPVNELYWRGPVYWTYSAGTWSLRPGFDKRGPRLASKLTGETLESQLREVTGAAMYDMTVFPQRSEFLYALDIPAFTPPSAYITEDWQLMNMNPVREMLTYRAMSYVQFRAGQTPDEATMALALQLPSGEEPRTQALGQQLAADHGPDPVAIARAGRRYFETGFEHDPAAETAPGVNPIDRFLFEDRKGFGMQFATAYALMMRAAGIPARVVSGYHGGLHMFLIERVYVLEKDKHAWVELYLEDYGWVRMDVARAAMAEAAADGIAQAPRTAQDSTAPETQADKTQADDQGQSNQGADTAASAAERPHWLESFDAKAQSRLLAATGLKATAGVLIAAGAGLTAMLALIWGGGRLWLRLRARRLLPQSLRDIDQFCRELARNGPDHRANARRANEGLRAYLARVLESSEATAQERAAFLARAESLCQAHYGR